MVDRELLNYVCGNCSHTFKQLVGKSNGGKRSKVSDKVKCPECNAGLKTWEGF